MGSENHKANVICIRAIEKHPNADTLGIVHIEGYQVIVKLADWKIGDLAVYIQPDSVVPERPEYAFLWADKEFPAGEVPAKYRRITVRRFRKEWSEGLLMPVIGCHSEGENLADEMNITHYEPPEDPESTKGDNEKGPGSKQNKRFPRSLKGWFYFLIRVLSFGFLDLNGNVGGSNEKSPQFKPIYDVESYKNYANVLQEGEEVVITEKIHGSNARYVYEDGHMYAGSRKLWKATTSKCIWRKVLEQHPWIEEWCRTHPSFTLYGEVVPTQKGYHYGCKDGETKFFVFDILTPEGKWVSRDDFIAGLNLTSQDVLKNWVPQLSRSLWNNLDRGFAEGPSIVPGAKHIREGIVIRPVVEREARNLGRVQLKIVSNTFLEKDNS